MQELPHRQRMAKCARYLAFIFLMCTVTIVAHAQYRASIRGLVTDPQGAIIPAATVTLTNKDTGQKLVSVSDDNGIYQFNALPPVQFSITAEKDGFKTKVL